MLYLFMRHKVRDYDDWKKVYDAQEWIRKKAGMTEKFLLRSENDPNEVFILTEIRRPAIAKTIVRSKEFRNKMRESGVIDEPEVYFVHDDAPAAAKASGF